RSPCSTRVTSCMPRACARLRATCCAEPGTNRSSWPEPGAAAAPPASTPSRSRSSPSSLRAVASMRSARAARVSSAAATRAARGSCAARYVRRSWTCGSFTPPSSWWRRQGLRPEARRAAPEGEGAAVPRGTQGRRAGAGRGGAAGTGGGGGGGGGGGRAPAEGDDRHVAVGRRVDLEELALGEAEGAREERPREGLDARVVALHVAVVDAARTGDLILGVRQLGLQLLEVLGRAQLRVGLGDCKQ